MYNYEVSQEVRLNFWPEFFLGVRKVLFQGDNFLWGHFCIELLLFSVSHLFCLASHSSFQFSFPYGYLLFFNIGFNSDEDILETSQVHLVYCGDVHSDSYLFYMVIIFKILHNYKVQLIQCPIFAG